MRLSKQDTVSIFVLGEIVGVCGYAIVRVQGFDAALARFVPAPVMPALFIIGIPVGALVSLLVASVIAKKIPVIYQIAKFIAVGVSNTMIDWGVLNLLLVPLGLGTASYVGGKGLSFAVATLNSYFWNKTWTFQRKEMKGAGKEALQFYLLTAVGLGINVGAATLFKEIGPNTKFWAGILAPGFATLLSAGWDFFAYRFIVFRQKEVKLTPDASERVTPASVTTTTTTTTTTKF